MVDTDLVLGQPIDIVDEHLGEPVRTDENEYRLMHFYSGGVSVEFHSGVSVFARFDMGYVRTGRARRVLAELSLNVPTKKPRIWGLARRWEPFDHHLGRLTIYYNRSGYIEAVTVATQAALEEMRRELMGDNGQDART